MRQRIVGIDISRKLNPVWLPFSFFVITVVTRIIFRSHLLYHLDSGHFALALQNYDISAHQPHPPGYFLYVMMGKVMRSVIEDANTIFVVISIISSGLTVMFLYLLGEAIFSKNVGVIAALIGITSPNLWFHGEVALTYAVEAFFSALTGYYCWRMIRGDQKNIWNTAVIMGIAGGIRQNTLLFLLPLWLYAVRRQGRSRIILSLCVMGVISMSWFIPMIIMTGGGGVYTNALKDLWTGFPGRVSVFHQGWDSFKLFSLTLARFSIYDIGIGMYALALGVYLLAKRRTSWNFGSETIPYFSIWVIPAALFHILIFIHPANPGYSLIMAPPLIIFTAFTIEYIAIDLTKILTRNMLIPIAVTTALFNGMVFLLSNSPVSWNEIKNHDRNLSVIVERVRKNDPETTAVIFTADYLFYSYRHLMCYLPDHHVYRIEKIDGKGGANDYILWGRNRKLVQKNGVQMPPNIKRFSMIVVGKKLEESRNDKGISIQELTPGVFMIGGPIGVFESVYRDIRSV